MKLGFKVPNIHLPLRDKYVGMQSKILVSEESSSLSAPKRKINGSGDKQVNYNVLC